NTTPGALATREIYPGPVWGSSAAKRRHDVAGEPMKLLLELLRREPLGPVDHEVLEPGVLRLDRADARDDVAERPAEPRLLLEAVGQRRNTGRGARCSPRAARLVGVAHEAEGREPLVALIVGRLDAALGFRRRVGQKEARAPDDVLAQ